MRSPDSQHLAEIQTWPQKWAIEEGDEQYGQQLLGPFGEFLLHLQAAGYAPNTIRHHKNGLFILGEQIIRRITRLDSLLQAPVTAISVMDNMINEFEGPLLFSLGYSENDQRQVDTTSRKLYKFRIHTRNSDTTRSGP